MTIALVLSVVKITAITILFVSIQEATARVNQHKIEKRDSATVDPFIKAIEELATAIPLDRYESDPILFQVVDSANSHSVYKDPQSDQIFYERSFTDRNKAVVVLSAEEDKIQLDGVKRLYIVLRASKLEGTPAKYYPSIAFLLNAEETTPGKITIAGKNYIVEWSVWHEGVLNGLKYSFNFHVCHYSVIIPCKVDPAKLNLGGTSNSKSEHKPKQPEADSAVAKSDPTQAVFPKSEYLEFFRDLDENKINGRIQIIGVAFDILSTAVDGIGSLWCGLSGLILGQCHQYDPGSNGYTKSQIGQAMVMANGTVLAGNAGMGNGILGTVINTVLPGNVNVPMALMNGGSNPQGNGPVAGILGGITGILGRKKRSDDQNTPRVAGWRTQYVKTIEPNVTFKAEGDVFYGLGNCPYVKGTTESFNKASTPEEVNKFYVNLLRNGCFSRVAKVIPALKSEGILEISGKSVKLMESTSILSQPKLTWIEEQKLCAAFEFHTLSKVYQEARQNPESLADPGSPLGKSISKDVTFLEKFTLEFINEARGLGKHHYIRLLRHVVKVLRSVLEKLGEDSRNLDACTGDCASDKELNLNDKLTIMGTIKFIMHGLPLTINVEEKLGPALKQFVVQHQAAIEIAVKEAKL